MKTFLEIVHDWVLRNNPKAIAQDIHKSYSTLLREINPDDPGAKLGINDFKVITEITNDFSALDYMERSLGRVAFEFPKRHINTKKIHIQLSKSLKEFGEFIEAVGDSIADGKLTPAEIDKCEKEGYELIQIVALLCYGLSQLK
ncbi:MAG: phage regulatory CII family protein [bacterium]|nr:MAG: phage regulatory CII family protein [bacterium]